MPAYDWGALDLAGAFTAGAILATLACIRIMRAVLQTYQRYSGPRLNRDAQEPPPPTPEDQ